MDVAIVSADFQFKFRILFNSDNYLELELYVLL